MIKALWCFLFHGRWHHKVVVPYLTKQERRKCALCGHYWTRKLDVGTTTRTTDDTLE